MNRYSSPTPPPLPRPDTATFLYPPARISDPPVCGDQAQCLSFRMLPSGWGISSRFPFGHERPHEIPGPEEHRAASALQLDRAMSSHRRNAQKRAALAASLDRLRVVAIGRHDDQDFTGAEFSGHSHLLA